MSIKNNNCIDCNKLVWKPYLRCKSCSRKGILSWTKSHTSETKEKMSLLKKGKYLKEANPNWGKGLKGKLNPNYKDGKTPHRTGARYARIIAPTLKSIFKICQDCKSDKNITVHHIDFNPKNNNRINLIVLCQKCNSKANWNKQFTFLKYRWINRGVLSIHG